MSASAAGPSFQLRPVKWETSGAVEDQTSVETATVATPSSDVDEEIPSFIRDWDNIVERADPSICPEGWQNWGLDISPLNIYVKRKGPDEKGDFVIPSKCTRCREKKKSCDRSVPCARCTRVGDECVRFDHKPYRFKRAPRSMSFSGKEEKPKRTNTRRSTDGAGDPDNGAKKGGAKRKLAADDGAPLNSSPKRSRKITNQVEPDTDILTPGADKPGKVAWHVVKSDVKPEPSRRMALQERPRIWATSRDELTSTYPPLLKTTSNTTPLVSFAPMVLLDNVSFPDGSWVDDGISITLRIQKRYTRSSNTSPGGFTLPPGGDENQDTVDMPRDLPEDIKTLSETHLTGAVMLAIAADNWNALPFQLPSEFKYSVLGFYHVTAVEHLVSRFEKSKAGRVSSLFSWRISLQWVGGGHEHLGALKSGSFEHPWWLSADQFRSSKASSSNNKEVECFSPSELNCVLVPRKVSCGALNSRTWLCDSCGKLNLCGWMGGQGCSSSICKNDGEALGYPRQSVSLSSARTKKRAFMNNELVKHCPSDTTETVDKSVDGAKIFTYVRENVGVQHLFANGVQELEARAEDFFNKMQTDVDMGLVPLRGSTKNNVSTLLFSSIVEPGRKSDEGPLFFSWKNAPALFSIVVRHLVFVVKQYFGKKLYEERFSQFEAHSWMESCTRKKRFFCEVEGEEKRVALICLGADVEIIVGSQVQTTSTTGSTSKPTTMVSKASNDGLHLTLSHGSVLFITGIPSDLYISSVHGFSMVLAACDPVA